MPRRHAETGFVLPLATAAVFAVVIIWQWREHTRLKEQMMTQLAAGRHPDTAVVPEAIPRVDDLAKRVSALGDGDGIERGVALLGEAVFQLDEKGIAEFVRVVAQSGGRLSMRRTLIPAAFERWSALDLGEAIRAADDVPEPFMQSAYQGLFPNWARADPAQSWRFLSENPQFKGIGRTALQSLMGRNPQKALELAEQGGLTVEESWFEYAEMAIVWAHRDAEGAFEWTRMLKEGNAGGIVADVVDAWGETDPERATAAALSLARQDVRENAVGRGLGRWVQQDLASAMHYLENELPDDLRTPGMVNYFSRYLWHLSAEEILKVAKVLNDEALAANLISDLASDDSLPHDTALELVSHLLQDEQRGRAVASVISQWYTSDRSGASLSEIAGWLEQLPEGPSKDEAIFELGRTLAIHEQSAAGLLISNTIANPAQRFRATRELAMWWMQRDYDAAVIWLEQSDAVDESLKDWARNLGR
jgi:hypothetical protein